MQGTVWKRTVSFLRMRRYIIGLLSGCYTNRAGASLLDGTWHVDYFPWGQGLWGKGNLSVYRTENYKLYNELCNLSKYCYAMKLGLTKQNYTKYTKKVRQT